MSVRFKTSVCTSCTYKIFVPNSVVGLGYIHEQECGGNYLIEIQSCKFRQSQCICLFCRVLDVKPKLWYREDDKFFRGSSSRRRIFRSAILLKLVCSRLIGGCPSMTLMMMMAAFFVKYFSTRLDIPSHPGTLFLITSLTFSSWIGVMRSKNHKSIYW